MVTQGKISGGGEGESLVWLPPGVKAAPKPKRNDPCVCGSGKKQKKCCSATTAGRPPCSVKDCEERVMFFLSPSVDGKRLPDRFWVACKEHVQDISASAAAVGLDVEIVSFDSIDSMAVAPDGVEVVREAVTQENSEPEA